MTGIIAEYNPFHAGHRYQLESLRKIFPGEEVIALMSGSFTQRGEPAILDKWTRASLAVAGGCDLVLELPTASAVNSAQNFARGAVRIFSELKIVDKLAFGAETSDLAKLQTAAEVFAGKNFSAQVKAEMSAGISYAAAVAKIFQRAGFEENFLQPNTILAVEYLRALPENIAPILIQRVGANYAEKVLQEKIASASAIRAEVYKKFPAWEKIFAATDKKVCEVLHAEKVAGLVQEEFLLRPLLAKIFSNKLPELGEGLENLVFKSAKSAQSFSELVSKVVSRRYPASRVKRLLLKILLDAQEVDAANFVRVLAFNVRGQSLLKKISERSNLPIVTKVTRHLTERDFLQKNFSAPYKKNLALDIAATNLRNILFAAPKSFGQDFCTSPQKI